MGLPFTGQFNQAEYGVPFDTPDYFAYRWLNAAERSHQTILSASTYGYLGWSGEFNAPQGYGSVFFKKRGFRGELPLFYQPTVDKPYPYENYLGYEGY